MFQKLHVASKPCLVGRNGREAYRDSHKAPMFTDSSSMWNWCSKFLSTLEEHDSELVASLHAKVLDVGLNVRSDLSSCGIAELALGTIQAVLKRHSTVTIKTSDSEQPDSLLPEQPKRGVLFARAGDC